MKKLTMIMAVALLTACGGNKNADENTESTITVPLSESDSISDEVRNFTSPDLTLYDLHSKVRKMVTDTYNASFSKGEYTTHELLSTDTIFFDAKGRMTRHVSGDKNGINVTIKFEYNPDGSLLSAAQTNSYLDGIYHLALSVKRDNDGYITSIESVCRRDESQGSTDTYTWKDGVLTAFHNTGWEWNTDRKYAYNEEGYRDTITEEFQDDGGSEKTVTRYTYGSYDVLKNWTERTSIVETTSYEWDPLTDRDHPVGPVVKDYRVEKRKIEY